MFERYTEAARRTLFFSRYETSLLGGMSIETEHILLGLLREKKGVTRTIFTQAKLSHDVLQKEFQSGVGGSDRVSTSIEIPFSEETKRVLRYAAEEADLLRHSYIGTEHLLLGLLREERSAAAAILARHGLTLESTRAAIAQLLTEGTQPSSDGPTSRMEQIDAIKSTVQQVARDAHGDVHDIVDRILQNLEELKHHLG
jgi:ATP-dependent Clp protease ATP-binding subunit ClpC